MAAAEARPKAISEREPSNPPEEPDPREPDSQELDACLLAHIRSAIATLLRGEDFIHAAAAKSRQIQSHIGVAQLFQVSEHSLTKFRLKQPGEVRLVDLDARRAAVMSHTQGGEPVSGEVALRFAHHVELLPGDPLPVGNAGGETG